MSDDALFGTHIREAYRVLSGKSGGQSAPTPEQLGAAVTDSVKPCRWTLDDDGVYDTECGNRWFFDTGTASENKAAFCMYCGKTLHDTEDAAISRLKRSGLRAPSEETK